jgi:Glycosyltransferase family 87
VAARAAGLGAATAAVTAVAPAGFVILVLGVASDALALYLPATAAVATVVPLAVVAVAFRRARLLTELDRTAIRAGYLVGVAVFLLVFLRPLTGGWRDASAYYSLGLADPYGSDYSAGGVRYAPPFFQATEPLRSLSWPEFLFLWTAAQLTALWIVAGPIAAALLVVPIVAFEAWFSNINLLLALAITFGFRWPGLWSVVLLTKITPGVGLVWFAVRREWRSLGIALGVTLGIVVLSVWVSPGLWATWLGALTSAAPPDRVADVVPLPVRVALGAVVVGAGGLTDRPWTVPLGAAIAMPVLWPVALAVLVAVIPLSRSPSPRGRRRAVDWALGAASRRDLTVEALPVTAPS